MYKYCIVPKCTNTSFKTPEKIFFNVPKDPKRRNKWYSIAKRDDKAPPSTQATRHCCEDHFDVEKDTSNFMKHKIVGCSLRLKRDVLPSKFECQEPAAERRPPPAAERRQKTPAAKRRRKAPAAKKSNLPTSRKRKLMRGEQSEGESQDKEDKSTHSDSENLDVKLESDHGEDDTAEYEIQFCETKYDVPGAVDPLDDCAEEPDGQTESESDSGNKKQKNNDVNNLRNDCVNNFRNDDVNNLSNDDVNNLTNDDVNNLRNDDVEDFNKNTLLKISNYTNLYLGLPKEHYFIIELLSEHTKCPYKNILIILKKIRLDDPYERLAVDFNSTEKRVRTLFKYSLPLVASRLRQLVHFPAAGAVRRNLPLVFRKRHAGAQCVLDRLEVAIPRPARAPQQAATWSNAAHAHCVAYLVSVTPDGLVNFVSEGYGAQASDADILEDCGILERLSPGAALVAAGGFRRAAAPPGLRLFRAPSDRAHAHTQKAIIEKKRFAAICGYLKITIGRLREFRMVSPRAIADADSVHLLDDVMVIACGIVNLQSKFTIQ